MIKIKVFRFLISNYGYTASDSFNKSTNYRFQNVCSEGEISDCINEFLDYRGKLIDLKVNTVEISKHNNGESNKVELIYTITYEEN